MAEQISQGDGVPGRRRAGVVELDRIVQFQFAAFFEQQDGRRRELFGDGADAELRVQGVGHLPLEVRRAIGLGEQHLVAARHQYRTHELLQIDVVTNDLIHAGGVDGFRSAEGRGGNENSSDEGRKSA